jgi:cob(I)alamin adenosyltransferase
VARTVCRRAEREVVALGAHDPVRNLVVVYLNRLSDLLFSLARWDNHAAGVADVPWLPR